MKLLYLIPAVQQSRADVASPPDPLILNGAKVSWILNPANELDAIQIELSGVQLALNERNVIDSSTPSAEETAYQIACYVSDRILVQTGADAIDPEVVFLGAPRLEPETDEEATLLKTHPHTVWMSVQMRSLTKNHLDPTDFSRGYFASKAFGHLADSRRVAHDFQKYELLYKVLECFGKGTGEAFDRSISALTGLPLLELKPLRLLRNRVVHPDSEQHIHRADRVGTSEIRAALPKLENAALKLLRELPPRM